ncbi:MAG: hypothetical protein J5762_01375 [Clostridia bacterium]|nr:hypothetical protein [Clostridia bacterium]
MKFKRITLLLLLVACLTSLVMFTAACKKGSGNASDASMDETTSDSVVTSDETPDSSDDSTTPDDSTTSQEPDLILITGVSPNSDFLLYNNNKSEKEEKENEFADLTRTYLVGDDNAFSMKPSVTFRIYKAGEDIPEPYNPETWNYVLNVYVMNGTQYVLLEGEDLTTYVEAVDAENCTVDFTADAIGGSFKLEVYPEGLTAKQLTDAAYKQTLEIKVIDGYNVYDEKELSYISNEQGSLPENAPFNAAWKAYKEANGLTATVNAAIILHKNMVVTTDDIPAAYFYSDDDEDVTPSDADYDRVIGTMKDRAGIYVREFGPNDSFGIYGNYFTIDCSKLPLIIRPEREIVDEGSTFQSHSRLIHFQCEQVGLNDTSSTMQDVNLIGNAPKEENINKAGGMIMHKATNVAFTAYNNISNSFIINYFPDITSVNYTIDSCKAYDAFDCLIYAWGAEDVVIKDSEIIGAGGPAMIVDHVDPSDPDGGTPSCVTVINSNIHSYITGQEAWFNMYNAGGIVAQIVSLNAGFQPFGRSFVKTRETGDGTLFFIDFVALYKSGEAEAVSSTKISGKFAEDDPALPMDFGTYTHPWDNFQTNTMASMYIEAVLGINNQLPIFMTSAGGMAFLNPNVGLMSIDFGTQTPYQITDPTDLIFSGNQLYLYYSRMALIFNYYGANETY